MNQAGACRKTRTTKIDRIIINIKTIEVENNFDSIDTLEDLNKLGRNYKTK